MILIQVQSFQGEAVLENGSSKFKLIVPLFVLLCRLTFPYVLGS